MAEVQVPQPLCYTRYCMKFLMLNGASCSGKSTIVKRVMKEVPGYYQLSYDSLKWGFSQYKPDQHFDDVRKLVRALAETLCAMKYNILCDSGLHKETREKLFEIVKRHNYEIVEVNLNAEYKVLTERFDKRIADAAATPGTRIANTSKERHKELYNIYESEKNPQAISFRTDGQSIDEIVGEVLKLM